MTPLRPASSALPGYRLALAATALAVVVVVLGAFTRLVDAGLGCPDWPGCYGHLVWPDTPEEIARAEAAFPDAPVDTSKTWPEMVHRYCASLLGVLIIALSVIALQARKLNLKYPVKLTLGLLVLVICQGAFGAWTVTLKLWPQVVTAHLLGGFSVLSLLWLLCLRLRNSSMSLPEPQLVQVSRFRPWLTVAIVLVVLQILLGGWLSSNYAAIACPDFPTCQGHWLPPLDFAQGFNLLQGIGPNYLGGLMDNDARVAIHFAHRVGALLVTLYLLLFCIPLWRQPIARLRLLAVTILIVLAVQVVLGVSNVVFQIPLPVAVAHNAVAALLLLTLVTLATTIHTATPDKTPLESADE